MTETCANRLPSLCVLNFNGAAVLDIALDAAMAIADCLEEIVVVDNGSTDSSRELIRERYPGIRLIENGANLGASAGRNAGLEHIENPRLILADNDVALNAEAIKAMTKALDSAPDAVVAVPMVCYADRPDLVQYGGSRCHYLGQQILERQDVPVHTLGTVPHDMDSLVSCCFLIDRSRLRRDVRFDESFFIYFEDHELGLRLRMLGHRLLAVPEARVLHGKGTEGLSIRQLGSYSPRRVFHTIRNRWLLLLKLYSARTLLLIFPMLLVYEGSQLLVAIKKRWMAEWLRACASIFADLPLILRRRRDIQRQRMIPDRQLLAAGRLPFRQELADSGVERAGLTLLDSLSRGYWVAISRLI
ncbi:MAG: glycosyltransferase family 2 protein [Steroidobacteraceae bacterium]